MRMGSHAASAAALQQDKTRRRALTAQWLLGYILLYSSPRCKLAGASSGRGPLLAGLLYQAGLP